MMGIVYRKQSKFTDALREYEEALRIEMATLGKNHPEVATTCYNTKQATWAMSCISPSSKFADALREYEEALRIDSLVYSVCSVRVRFFVARRGKRVSTA